MISIVTAVAVSCLLVATVTPSGAYVLPSNGHLPQSLADQARTLVDSMRHLCWEEQDILPMCQRYTVLLRQLLDKLLSTYAAGALLRPNGLVQNYGTNAASRRSAKRTEEDAAGFYSNW